MIDARGRGLTADARRIARVGAAVLTIAATAAATDSQPETFASHPPPTGDGDSIADGYVAGDYGRIRFVEDSGDGLHIRRTPLSEPGAASTAQTDPGDPNAPIFPGDAVLTDSEQRVEVELASGSLVRIDRDSDVTFLALPSPYGATRDNTVLQLAAGTVRVDSQNAQSDVDGEFRIDTPGATVYLIGQADARVDVDLHGETEVVVRRGVIEVVTESGSTVVRGGMRTTIPHGQSPATPQPFNTFTADGFDRWVAQREASDRYDPSPGSGEEVYAELPEEVQPYHRELSVYGDWDYEEEYGYVWSPRAVERDWRPYRSGYWHYGAAGYFWVADEAWGWAPYHYGRWVFVHGRWCWTPGRVFGGAWVAWSWGSAYVGWAPLDYWNRPVWVGTLYYDYYDPRCWTFVSYNTLAVARVGRRGPYRDTYTTFDVGVQLTGSVVVTRAPNVSPEALRASADARRTAIRIASEDVAARTAPPTRRVPTTGSFDQADATLHGQLVREAPRRSADSFRRAPAPPATPGRASSPPPPVATPTTTERAPTTYYRSESSDRRRDATSAPPKSTERPSTYPGRTVRTSGSRDAAATTIPRNSLTPQRTSDPRDLYRRMSEQPRTQAPPSRSLRDDTRKRPQPAPRTQPQRTDTRRTAPKAKPPAPKRPEPKRTETKRKDTTKKNKRTAPKKESREKDDKKNRSRD